MDRRRREATRLERDLAKPPANDQAHHPADTRLESCPGTADRVFIVPVVPGAVHVVHDAGPPQLDGKHVQLDGRRVRVGSMTWLAPNDSNYVAWAMPERPAAERAR